MVKEIKTGVIVDPDNQSAYKSDTQLQEAKDEVIADVSSALLSCEAIILVVKKVCVCLPGVCVEARTQAFFLHRSQIAIEEVLLHIDKEMALVLSTQRLLIQWLGRRVYVMLWHTKFLKRLVFDDTSRLLGLHRILMEQLLVRIDLAERATWSYLLSEVLCFEEHESRSIHYNLYNIII